MDLQGTGWKVHQGLTGKCIGFREEGFMFRVLRTRPNSPRQLQG